MKKKIRLLFLTYVVAVLLCSCVHKVGESNLGNLYSKNVTDEPLDSCLTVKYDIDDLRSFFENRASNESIGFGKTEAPLLFSEVNGSFPVEVVRSNGYSVYKVSQGGYYYVFWVEPFENGHEVEQSENEPSVYFSAYIFADLSDESFKSLTPGVSTAEDVKRIDPSFELSFLLSSGVFSYSYINDETVMRIEYKSDEGINDYNGLVVKEISVIPRKSAPSRYSSILSDDLP